MERIRTYFEHGFGPRGRLARVRQQIEAGIKWWAEHQAWPATDDIRIERRRTPCG